MKNLKNSESGFSLVEVLVASGIMGVMAVFFYKSFNDNMKQQKTVTSKMEESNVINEIRLLLMNQENCSETLKDQVFKLDLKEKDTLEEPIVLLKKVLINESPGPGEDPEKVTLEKYHLYDKSNPKSVYGNARVKIASYSLEYTKETVENLSKVRREEVNFMVKFARNSNSFGTKEKAYKIPLEITVDESMKLLNCSSLGLPHSGNSSILTLDANTSPSYLNQTGTNACKSKGMNCSYVQSTNYVLKSEGHTAPLYTPACASSYNKSLQGVKNGVGISNIHSCEAKLGAQETFTLVIDETTNVICAGTFVAFCN